ncbi:hypothetical protein SEA_REDWATTLEHOG_59 [Gordonia phage RedWattleHog]|uniref:Uncharacterized protein n=1 Tax=Gordonia phage Stormageddon TaxID=2656541 RepID=A0A649VSK1_9CAUD|nr:hypothetical protein KHQ86_gp056 [Gordonia phage Stormageddon]QGJ94919.1 hypothetical protein SEA_STORMAGEDDON_56 [Gordonia phage Stormageddon]QLF83563.1 hypothetical protein SEA_REDWATTLEHOG_59 [Gordonia phage RedWattleHog]
MTGLNKVQRYVLSQLPGDAELVKCGLKRSGLFGGRSGFYVIYELDGKRFRQYFTEEAILTYLFADAMEPTE